MKQTKLLMGMPISVEIIDPGVSPGVFEEVFALFQHIDETFSTYKPGSEISRLNRGEIKPTEYSEEMKTVLALCEQTKRETAGFFDIQTPAETLDPSGLVKGWAIHRAAKLVADHGFRNFYIEAGGDIQASGRNASGQAWSVGIRNPTNRREIVKILGIQTEGVATSGTYIRNQHIYNPHERGRTIDDILSLTVVGPNIYEADRFATAAFAMGRQGIKFIQSRPGVEGYLIDKNGLAAATSGLAAYVRETV